jgi:putative membrane protein
LLISLTNTAVFTAAISIVTPAFFFAAGYIFDTDETNNKGIIEEFQEFGIDWIPMLISLAIIVGVIGVISYIFTFVYIFTSYGNFQVKSNPDDIRIEYGLLNRKVFQIPKEQIRSLRISEPFLSRVFGYRQLELDSISPRSKSVLLHPIIKGDQLEGFLQKNVPEIENQVLSYRPVKGSLFMFAVKSGVIPVAGAFILSLFHNYGLYLLLSLPIFLLYGFLKWKHSGLAFDDDFITVRKTKRFKRITVISMKKYTQATEVKQNFLMKRNQVSHYNFSLFSGKSSEDYRCDYLPEALKRPFLDYTVSAGKNDGGNRI